MKIEIKNNLIYATDEDTEETILLGNEEELRADYQEECMRNNERRSFDAWLEDKAENEMY